MTAKLLEKNELAVKRLKCPATLEKNRKSETTELTAHAFEALVVRAIDGDNNALHDLCQIGRRVLFTTVNRLHNWHDAQDAGQEVMIRVCEKIRGLNSFFICSFFLLTRLHQSTIIYFTVDYSQVDMF